VNARTRQNPMSKAALTATMISISMEDSPPANFHAALSRSFRSHPDCTIRIWSAA
jgi:hypothetical protein